MRANILPERHVSIMSRMWPVLDHDPGLDEAAVTAVFADPRWYLPARRARSGTQACCLPPFPQVLVFAS